MCLNLQQCWWQRADWLESSIRGATCLCLQRVLLKGTRFAFWPFHFGTVDLIIQILPSGMGHCNWIFSRPKRYFVLFLQLQTAHMVSHHLLGLNSSLGQHTSICFFYIYRCGPATSSIVMLLLLLSKAVKCGIHSPKLTPVSALLLHSFH